MGWGVRAALGFIMASCASLFFLLSPMHAGVKEGVIGEGESVVVGITAEEARLIALQRARADAVEKATGIKILGSTLVKNGLLVGEFLKTFSRGFIVDQRIISWDGAWINSNKGPSIPRYRVKIQAKVMIPEKRVDQGFVLKASLDRPSYLCGENALIRTEVSERACLAIFNLMADDRVTMIYPDRHGGMSGVLDPGLTFIFPPPDSGQILEMVTLPGHKRDSEAFMVVALKSRSESPFHFLDHFSEGKFYAVPEFFAIYSRFAEMAVEKILPYEVRKKEIND